jgi:hypothetical protein
MRIPHQACVITSLDATDLWQTERRSSDWNVGHAAPDARGSVQLEEENRRPTERWSSDWNVGDAPPEEADSMQLELMPVESTGMVLGKMGSMAAHTHADPFLRCPRWRTMRRAPIA